MFRAVRGRGPASPSGHDVTAREHELRRRELYRANGHDSAARSHLEASAPEAAMYAMAAPVSYDPGPRAAGVTYGIAVSAPAPSLLRPTHTHTRPGQLRSRRPIPPRRWTFIEQSRWPLVIVLLIQSALSLRLIWSNTAFQDEALYIWSGRLEWSHWLYGAPIPPFPTYFSGAPVVYPPIAGYVDAVAGLAGTRLLSLLFLLIATTFLHGVTRRIFDRRSAFFAVALFVSLGSIQFLGALATYDAMAVMLLALATWLGVRAADCRPVSQRALLALSAATLALADVTKYAAALYDPVVVAVIVLVIWRTRGRRLAMGALAIFGIILSLLLIGGVAVGGHMYWQGIESTTLSRQEGTWPAFGILYVSAGWIGAVILLAAIGAVVVAAIWRDWPTRLLGLTLLLAPFLAPAEQARIHVFTSLFKHVGFGGWFGAIVAGFALASFVRVVPALKANAAESVSLAAVVLAAVPGIGLATAHYTGGWPNSAEYVADLRPLVSADRGVMLFDDVNIVEYYLPGLAKWQHVINNVYFAYTDPVTGKRLLDTPAAYSDAIEHHYFGLIGLIYGNAANTHDPEILADIKRYGGYKKVLDLPYRLEGRRGEFLVFVRQAGA
jgi:4-amino-4-deoxy-L-arabinose transferase-like glycosyltransferase